MKNNLIISDTFNLKIIKIKDIMELSDVSYTTAQRIYSAIRKQYNKKRVTMADYIKYYCAD